MFQVIITPKHSLSFPCTVSLSCFIVKIHSTQLPRAEQKLEAQGCLGTDSITMPTGAILLFIHTIKAKLMEKKLGNKIINYNWIHSKYKYQVFPTPPTPSSGLREKVGDNYKEGASHYSVHFKNEEVLGQCLYSFFLSETSVDPCVGNPFISAPLQSSLPLLASLDSCTAFLGHMRLTKGEIRG